MVLTDELGKSDGFTHGRDVLVGLEQVALTLDSSNTAMGSVQFAGGTRAAVLLGDDGVELGSIQERIGSRTDTRRIITLVVGKSTPF